MEKRAKTGKIGVSHDRDTHTQCVYSRTWNNLDFVVVLGALLRGFTHQNLWTSTLADASRCWRLDWLSLNSKCSSNMVQYTYII